MRQALTALALPAITVALAGVLWAGQSSSASGLAPSVGSLPSVPTQVQRVETGTSVAVTRTNWQETTDASTVSGTPGRPKR